MPLPRDAQAWDYHPDPADKLPYGIDVSALLDDGTVVASEGVVVSLSADAQALGLRVVQDAETLPRVAGDGHTIVFWLTVDPAHHDDPDWDGWGRDLPVSVTFWTDGAKRTEFQRDFVITVRDR